MAFIKKLKRENKPWAMLGMSRRQYEVDRPWKRAGLPREMFEEVLVQIPIETIKEVQLEADAEMLLKSVFGQGVELV